MSRRRSAIDAAGRAVAVARRVARVTSDQNVTFLAAGVAYYAFVSVLPAAVLALVVAVAVGGDRLAAAVVEASAGVLTETGQRVVIDALVGGAGQGSATLISLPLTLWGTLKVLRGLDIAFSIVYGAEERQGLLDQVRNALLVAASIGGGLLAMLALAGVVAALDVSVVAEVARLIALPVLLTTVFLPMYYVFPDVNATVREVVPGAVFAGVGWTLLGTGFQAYVDFQAVSDGGQAAVYGTLGAILLFVTFLYFGATLVLVGAVVNVVLEAGTRGGDGNDPNGSRGETGNIKGQTRVQSDE